MAGPLARMTASDLTQRGQFAVADRHPEDAGTHRHALRLVAEPYRLRDRVRLRIDAHDRAGVAKRDPESMCIRGDIEGRLADLDHGVRLPRRGVQSPDRVVRPPGNDPDGTECDRQNPGRETDGDPLD